MSRTSSRIAVIALAALAAFWVGLVSAQAGKSPVIWPAGDIKWTDSPAAAGAKIAVLWGDPKTGAYGALKRIGAGTPLPMHTHASDQKVIVVAGTIALALEGGSAKDMGPGSYVFMPGGVRHKAECKAGADCIYFEEQPAASDIKFVEAPKK